MNVKYFLLFAVLLLFVMAANAQNQEPTDSLTRELQEVVVNAKQPATKLVGTTLVSTIPAPILPTSALLSMCLRSCR